MSDRRLLVLWDVDHTLIENAGVSKENYARAFELLTGRRPERPARTDGRTDPEIMRGLLSDNGADPAVFTEHEVTTALAAAMEHNVGELLRRGFMLPGVAETLATLSEIDLVVQSVLTGNIAPNAATKLRLLGAVRLGPRSRRIRLRRPGPSEPGTHSPNEGHAQIWLRVWTC